MPLWPRAEIARANNAEVLPPDVCLALISGERVNSSFKSFTIGSERGLTLFFRPFCIANLGGSSLFVATDGFSDPQFNPQNERSSTTSVVLGVPHGFVSC